MLMMYNDGHKCGDLSNKLDIRILNTGGHL